jgi:hypothetical protein
MFRCLFRSTLIICLLLQGLCLAQSAVPFDPSTITDGHVYLFEGGAPTDATPQAHDLPIVGAPQTVQGLNGDALQFDGAADGLNLPDSEFINTGGTAIFPNRTVIAVFKCDDVDAPGKQTVFEEGGTTRGSNIYVSEGLVYVAAWNRAEYNWDGEWPSAPIESGEWYVAAMVIREGGEAVEPDKFEMWLNGELIAKLPGGQMHDHGDDGAVGYTQVNSVFHDGNASPALGHYFGGAIDELWILNEALTPAQLSALGPNPALAKNALPANEGVDVLRDDDLSWEPGVFAQSHDVYFGTVLNDVNEATRDNPLGVLASQGQTGTSYDPGRLDFGQTYFWRVDEVNGAPDRTVFKGELWSFESEPFAIAVSDITATATSSHDATMAPEKTIDGSGLNALDQHSTEATAMWLSGMGDPTPSIQYEFDKSYKLHEMWVWNSNQPVESFVGLGAKDVTIETSMDGVDWTVLADTPPFNQAPGQANYAHNTSIDLGGTVAKYVKLTISAGHGMIPQYGLSEVRFLYVPTNARELQPADGTTTTSADLVLSWRAGREAASHEVYLGTDPDGLSLASTTQETSYQTMGLDYATTYYWQIVEVNDAEDPPAYAGDIVSFATPAYGTVDSFDQYDNDCDRIFFAWEDGLGHNGGEDVDNCNVAPSNGNGGGSIVGNAQAPFAETSIVRSGQSMPLEYDNAFGPSEASLRLDSQDWTANGVQSLSLYFRGDPGNTGQLYVKINNTKVSYNGLPGALQRAQWLPWNIDLNTVGGNLQSVTSLTIGIEGASANGMVYIDDIRLYPLAPELITPTDPDPANLVAHYTFDGNANDSVGGLHGTLVGNASFAPGQQGQALSLNTATVTDYVDIVGYQGILGTSAITVTAWVKTTSDATGAIIGWGPNVGGQRFGFRIDAGRIRHEHHGGNIQGDTVMNDGSWHHAAITVEPNATVSWPEAKLWLDGLDDTRPTTDPDPYAIIADLDVSIGRRPAGDDRYFIGEIDELYIYDRVLSAAEIAGLAGLTQPFDKPFD